MAGAGLNCASMSSTVGRMPGDGLKHLATVWANDAGKSGGNSTVSSGHAVVR